MKNMFPLFIYHADCFDGFTAAWIYDRYVGDADFHAARYGEPAPDVTGRDVIMADYTFPIETMQKIVRDCSTLLVLDHHHTAQEALSDLITNPVKGVGVVFDMNRSGAGIVWDYFHDSHQPRPSLVNYVEDRDLWRHKLPGSEDFSALVAATSMTFQEWDKLAATPVDVACLEGAAINKYIRQFGVKATADARLIKWRGIDEPVWTMNIPYMNCSEHINKLLTERGGKFAASFYQQRDGKWKFSLRSGPDFDVSSIAKRFGGGGHKQASGFEVGHLGEVFFSRIDGTLGTPE